MSVLPSLHFPSLDEAAEVTDPVLGAEEKVLPVRWTEEVLMGLDWRKLMEIVRALAVSGGCEPGETRLWADGTAECAMSQGRGSDAMKLVARLAPWNRWMASSQCIEKFAADLAGQKKVRGVYVAPAGPSLSARIAASRLNIEVLDAQALAAALNDLPAAHSEFYHDLTLAGQPFVPSCPVCLRPLMQTPEEKSGSVDGKWPKMPDLCYHTSDIVAEQIVARRVEILRNCEVHFLREVRARDVFIQGVVIGDFVCEGSILLNPGAVLTGNVAARSVLVRPGAELNGETRILQGNLGSAGEQRREDLGGLGLEMREPPQEGWLRRCSVFTALKL